MNEESTAVLDAFCLLVSYCITMNVPLAPVARGPQQRAEAAAAKGQREAARVFAGAAGVLEHEGVAATAERRVH